MGLTWEMSRVRGRAPGAPGARETKQRNMSLGALSKLPMELVFMIIDCLSQVERFPLRLTCARFYQILSAPGQCTVAHQNPHFGFKRERDAIRAVLKRERFFRLQKEMAENPRLSARQALCWNCMDAHPRGAFFDAQLDMLDEERGCKKDGVMPVAQAVGHNLSYQDLEKMWCIDYRYIGRRSVFLPWNAVESTALKSGWCAGDATSKSAEKRTPILEPTNHEGELRTLLPVQLRWYNLVWSGGGPAFLRKPPRFRQNVSCFLRRPPRARLFRMELEMTGFHMLPGLTADELGDALVRRVRLHDAVELCQHISSNADVVVGLCRTAKWKKGPYRSRADKESKPATLPVKSSKGVCKHCKTEFWWEHLSYDCFLHGQFNWPAIQCNYNTRTIACKAEEGFFLVVVKKIGNIEKFKDPLKNTQWLKHVVFPGDTPKALSPTQTS